ncbi:MAG TPA: hypothetical protein VG098_05860 [Nitrososphaera sp.]|nr:hypothetical protein [Nitrososphaera sp.]
MSTLRTLQPFEMPTLLSTVKLYYHTITIEGAVLATSIKLPTSEEIKKLSLADIAIAAGLADEFRDRLREYVHIDPYCVPDPFTDKDDCNYFVILDRENLNRIVALLANKKGTLPQLPWSAILSERLVKVSVSKGDALAIKHELMPKETNNFYPYRRDGITSGYLMFAFQICG